MQSPLILTAPFFCTFEPWYENKCFLIKGCAIRTCENWMLIFGPLLDFSFAITKFLEEIEILALLNLPATLHVEPSA